MARRITLQRAHFLSKPKECILQMCGATFKGQVRAIFILI